MLAGVAMYGKPVKEEKNKGYFSIVRRLQHLILP
jgi:hypothetical protein